MEPFPTEGTGGFDSTRLGVAGTALLMIVVALIWQFVYTPVALIVAAVSRSFLKTLNPILGVDTIIRMGSVYWQALLIYAVISGIGFVAGAMFGLIPFLGGVVQAFISAYVWLAVGCTLGLAVFKKAPELGLD
jgi:hypothetical protein